MSNLELIKNFRASLGLPPAPPITALPSTEKLLKHSNDKFLQVILDDVPYWRRGLSLIQYNKIDKLHLNLRDDIYENSTHRVRRALRLIGLNKRFTTQELKHFIKLSEGDDLAFLWFVLHDKYGIPTPETITVEQQTIMSGIAHLNMLATLQELDRVLPEPQVRCKDARLAKYKSEIQRSIKNYQRVTKLNLGNNNLKPYTQSQRLPLPYGKSLILKKPNVRISYNIAERVAALKNEGNQQRMFPSFRFFPDSLFPNEEEQKTEQQEEPLVDLQTQLCLKQYHEIKAVEQSLEETLQQLALKNCSNQYKSEQHRQEIRAQLQKQVNFEMDKFRKYSQKYRLRPLIKFLNHACEDCAPISKENIAMKTIDKELSVTPFKGAFKKCECEEASESTGSDKLFFATQSHKPYKFDYQKIFTFKDRKKEDMSQIIGKELEECKKLANIDLMEKSREFVAQHGKKPCYDCNDLMLMHNMLRDALEYLAQNPKLLLPAFPDAHKLILLRGFIVARYGKKYTLREQKDAVFLALRALYILERNFKLLHLPSFSPILKYNKKNYNFLNQMRKKTEKWHNRFTESMNNQILTYTRNVWAGTRSATLDIKTRIYLTYLPTRPKDVIDLYCF